MTEDQFIDGVFDREGRTFEEPPRIDQPTAPGGVTRAVLSAFRGRPCTVEDLRALTVLEAREVIRWTVRRDLARCGFDRIAFEPLRLQVLDFAWNSGEGLATRWLQRALGMAEPLVTGVMDARTVGSLAAVPGPLVIAVHNALAAERAHMVRASTRIDQKFKCGVMGRAIDFVIPVALETDIHPT
jgi:lysozyme family protein